MATTLLRSVLCFCAAVVLLALGVCALEFGCRSWAFWDSVDSRGVPVSPDEITIPSATSWTEVRRLVDFRYALPDGASGHIRTNELGIRGPSFAIPKPLGTYRILCLGGSSLFGTEVAEEETVAAYLQKNLSLSDEVKIEVINGGCPKSGPLSHVLRYRSTLSALQPDLVLLCLSVDDLVYDLDVRGALRLDPFRQPAYAAHPAALKHDFSAVDGIRRDFVSLSWLIDWAGRTFMTSSSQHPALVPREGGYGRRELGPIASLSQMVSANYGRLIVSTTPSAWGIEQTRNAITHQRPLFSDDLRKVLLELKISDQIPVHDMMPEICQIPTPQTLFSNRRGNLTARGNELYAESLTRYLTQRVPELMQVQAQSKSQDRF